MPRPGFRILLRDDSIESPTDHLGELWASELPVLPVESDNVQGAISGQVQDLNGRFNVNNLLDANGKIDEDYLEQFRTLMIALDIDPRFAGLAADWIDRDQNASFPDGAEDSIYTGLTPPYRSYNRPIVNVTELAALEGMDKATFDLLLPHITALPPPTTINVNTATAAVLQSLDPNIDAATAESLLEEREQGGFAEVQQRFGTFVTNQKILGQLAETSEYFQLNAVVQIDTVRVNYFSVIHRAPNGGPVTTLFRSLGTL